MGVLDEAIREHLELKRRRGADPAEVERAVREALGPVRRGPEELGIDSGEEPPGFEHAADTGWGDLSAEAGVDEQPAQEYEAFEDSEAATALHEPAVELDPFEPEAPVDHQEPPSEPESPRRPAPPLIFEGERTPPGVPEAPAGPTPDPFEPTPDPFEPATAEPTAEPATHEPSNAIPARDQLGEETEEYDVEQAMEEDHAAAAETKPAEDDDMLEGTPEFLQDTPDHDRLWFEQRPPKDFDFDG